MELQRFFNLYLLLPLSVLSTFFGYVESVYKLTGIPYVFLLTSAGFLLALWSLVWLIWFSRTILSPGPRKIALAGLIAVSILYYSFIEYYLVLATRNDVLATVVEFEDTMNLATEDPEVAVMKISRLIHKLGETPPLLNKLGMANYKLGKYPEAVQDFTRAVQGDPKNREYAFNMAVMLREICDFWDARIAFDNYVKSNPDDVKGHYNRGVVYHYSGDYDTALAEYAVVVRANEPGREARVESALFNSGVGYALKFARASDQDNRELYLGSAIRYLERSVSIGGSARIAKIRAALVPLRDRLPAKCEGYYATDDLTALTKADQFKKWITEKMKLSIYFKQDRGTWQDGHALESKAPAPWQMVSFRN